MSAILIAAGESERMGRPKPLLPWQGVTLVEYQIAALKQGGAAEVVVVLGHLAEHVIPLVSGPGVRHVVNPEYEQGKTTSIKAGLAATDPSAEGTLLLAVDQPRPARIVAAIIESHRRNEALITSPRYEGHGGHPLVFAAALKSELAAVSEQEQGVREVLQAHAAEVNGVEIDDPLVRLDINTPEEYEAARARYGS